MPAGLRDGRPRHQLRPSAQHHPLHAAWRTGYRRGQLRRFRTAIELEVLRLEHLAAYRFQIGVIGQLRKTEIHFARFRQCHDRQVVADQHGVAAPGHLQLVDLLENDADGDVDADHAFEESIPVDRRNGRHHPAVPGRVQIDVGPHHAARGVVLGIGQVIEVVLRDVHIRRVLIDGEKPRIDVVEAVPAVEIQACYQRVARLDFLHQRFQLAQPGDLLQIMLLGWRRAGIEHRRATVIVGAVAHAVGAESEFRQLRRRSVLQGLRGEIAVELGKRADLGKLLADQARFEAGRGLQIIECGLAKVVDLRVADRAVGQQIDRDQRGFHQDQRNQRAANEGSPDPLTQADWFGDGHDRAPAAAQGTPSAVGAAGSRS
jgi:hypothetical protein